MDLLKLARKHETEGGTFYMLPYSTPLMQHVAQVMSEAFPKRTFNQNVYAVSLPLTVGFDPVPENAPAWAEVLRFTLKEKRFFTDPVQGWHDLAAIAPVEIFDHLWAAYNATRPVELMADPDVQTPLPMPELPEPGQETPESDPTSGTGES